MTNKDQLILMSLAANLTTEDYLIEKLKEKLDAYTKDKSDSDNKSDLQLSLHMLSLKFAQEGKKTDIKSIMEDAENMQASINLAEQIKNKGKN